MRASKPRDRNSHCFRCYLRREICICRIIPVVQTQTEVLILRHVRETGRPSNTGRLIDLSLPNSRILTCGGGDRIGLSSVDEELLHKPGTWLLWPDGTSAWPGKSDTILPDRIVVLDSTWRQARRLYSRLPVLRSMPRLALPAPTLYRNRLRKQNRSDGMSTIEAVAAALAMLEGYEVAQPLERLFDEVVQRTITWRWNGNLQNILLS
ncbi:MAG: tRNA-uridine aminocarboxypropyltransferase [Smithella sp.]